MKRLVERTTVAGIRTALAIAAVLSGLATIGMGAFWRHEHEFARRRRSALAYTLSDLGFGLTVLGLALTIGLVCVWLLAQED